MDGSAGGEFAHGPRVRARYAPGVLRIEDVHKRFGELVAVDGLSLRVRAGECVGLLRATTARKKEVRKSS